MADRIYGDFQTAGFKITTTGKSQVSNAGTDGYALAFVQVDTSGNPVGPSGTNPNNNPATVYTAQQTATSSAVALASQALVNGVVLTNLSTSTNNLYVGPSGVTAGTGYLLVPGQSISFGVTNTNAIYVIAPTGSPVLNVAGN
jgi:hypothetical protein